MTRGKNVQITTTRTNKLTFDEYTGRFYFESKIEGLARACKTRAKHIEAMNKGEELRLEARHRQMQGKADIFEMKTSRETDSLKESLKDMVAHRNALEQVSKYNAAGSVKNENFGQYGTNASRKELLPMIEMEKQKMDSDWRRKNECKLLLSQRKNMEVIDRQMPTSRILLSWRRKHSMVDGAEGKVCSKAVAKLVLPPLHVTIRTVKQAKSVSDVIATADEEQETASLPSIFITHTTKSGVVQSSTNL